MQALEFDEATHAYSLGGRVVPSVTSIVTAVCPMSFPVDDWYLARGATLHKAIALDLRGRLDPASVDTEIVGRLDAARRAVKILGLAPLLIEERLHHPKLHYAGTLDLMTDGGFLVDWKSSVQPGAEPQLGGYSLALKDRGYKVLRCAAIELQDNGEPKLHEFKVWHAEAIFRACLTIYGWRNQ